ncbi:L-threonylcarbamoyladenylate synthase [Sphingomonas donggukensis]|uniref:Threonylcarbamoyl-AMP synthase n=1 Tax=Sphingomonas donggukensis TaxID=2949093 RepID=A0ABY4TUJ4_9SPHN|nr:L-threonylcarbamoyladenylate synthase [Sphingomonas donggukensis]URW75520.1 L-threonylcarbamoyladenylate synthase [Sphingomonas donggukensis]
MTITNTRTLPYGDAAIAEAARIIADGGCVAVPTETVYGLAADATDSRAVAGIYAAKGRPSFNPLIVHVADLAAAEALAVFDDDARALATRFWPGPLTLVLPVRDGAVAGLVTAGLATVAVRVPAHRAMQALLAATGKPLAAPSANASNRISPTTAAHVLATLEGRIALVIDDGPTTAGLESTIVQGREILRAGPITADQIASCSRVGGSPEPRTLPSATLGSRLRGSTKGVVAPGQLASHYAPTKPVRLDATDWREGEWLIGFGAIAGDDTLSAVGDPVEAAANLFAALHRADASDRAAIAVAPIPRDGIGEAINDRLARAAHGSGVGGRGL